MPPELGQHPPERREARRRYQRPRASGRKPISEVLDVAKTVRRLVAVRKGARGEVCHSRGSELCAVRHSRLGRPTCAVRSSGELCAVRRWAQGVLGPVVFDTAPTMAGVQ